MERWMGWSFLISYDPEVNQFGLNQVIVDDIIQRCDAEANLLS
jgi:hypothetical protein